MSQTSSHSSKIENIFCVNKIVNDCSNRLDKYFNSSTSGINTTFTNSNSNNNIYFSQSVIKFNLNNQNLSDLSITGSNSTTTRSTTLLTSLPTLFRNSSFHFEKDLESEINKTLSEDKLITKSENSIEKTVHKTENLLSFSPITPIIDYTNNSEFFSDYSFENLSNKTQSHTNNTNNQKEDLVYKSIMIIDVLNRLKNSSNSSNRAESNTENSVYKSELKLNNQTSTNSLIKNAIKKSFNNFYLLNDINTKSNNNNNNEFNSTFQPKSENENCLLNSGMVMESNQFDKKTDSKMDWTDLSCKYDKSKSCLSDEKQVNSYDLTQSEKFGSNAKSLKRFLKKTGKATINSKKLRKKVKDNPFFVYNKKGLKKHLTNNLNKIKKYSTNHQQNKKADLATTDIDSIVSSFSYNDYHFAFDCVNSSDSNYQNSKLVSKREKIYSKKKKSCSTECSLSRKTKTKSYLSISKSCSSTSSSSNSSSSHQLCREHSCNSSLSSNRHSSLNRCRRSSSNSDCSSNSCSSQNEFTNNPNNNLQADFSNNELEYLQNGEIDDHNSTEFARADDDYEMNDQIKSSDDDLTYSYGDILNQKENVSSKITETINETPISQKKIQEIIDLIIHRLPGEKLGLNLKVEPTGNVLVVSVTPNSAADRASDSNGNPCPIKTRDEIIEINGVSLNNMNNEEILSVVQELPLHVSLKLKRTEFETMTSPLSANDNLESMVSGHSTPNIINIKIPHGYNLHTIYLSSLESKCIMPCDLKDCSDAEGLYKIQKNTLQIGEQDCLKKGDILYFINGEQLAYKNKFELVSKLSSLEGIAEISVLRKNNTNCFGTNIDQIPYHNGIFAQNSIKLAMRKYDKPSIKSNSEADLGLTSLNTPDILANEEMKKSSKSLTNEQDSTNTEEKVNMDKYKATLIELQDSDTNNENHIYNLNHDEPIISSFHNDNWLLYDKNSSLKLVTPNSLNSTYSKKSLNDQNQSNFNDNIELVQSHDFDEISKKSIVIELDKDKPIEVKYEVKNEIENLSEKQDKSISISKTNTFTNQIQTNENLNEASSYFDHIDGTVRSLTSSSCHSERSLIHLNCVVCFEDENLINKTENQLECYSNEEIRSDFNEAVNLAGLGNGIGVGLGACAQVTKDNQAENDYYLDDDENNKKLSVEYEAKDCHSENLPSLQSTSVNNAATRNSATTLSCESKLNENSKLTCNELKKSSIIDEKICLPAYCSIQPTVATRFNTDSENSIRSIDSASNKYVSTCQIEIKNSFKNQKTHLNNLKIVKPVVNCEKNSQTSIDKIENQIENETKHFEINEMTFNKEVKINSSNSELEIVSSKENINYVEIQENEEDIAIAEEKNELSDYENNKTCDLNPKSTEMNTVTVIEDNLNQEYNKENTENDCDQNSLKISTEKQLSCVEIQSKDFENEEDEEDEIGKALNSTSSSESFKESFHEEKHQTELISSYYEDDNMEIIKNLINEMLDNISDDNQIYKEENDLPKIENVISLCQKSSASLNLVQADTSSSILKNDSQTNKQFEFNDLKKLMHEELSFVMKDKASSSKFGDDLSNKSKTNLSNSSSSSLSQTRETNETTILKYESNIQGSKSKISSTFIVSALPISNNTCDTTLSQLITCDDNSSNIKQSTQLNLGICENFNSSSNNIPPAPPIPDKLFGSVSDIFSSNNSFDFNNKTLLKTKNTEFQESVLTENKSEMDDETVIQNYKIEQDLGSNSSGIDTLTTLVKDLNNTTQQNLTTFEKVDEEKESKQDENSLNEQKELEQDKDPDSESLSISERLNNLMSARPFNSLHNSINKQSTNLIKSSSSYSTKSLINAKKQNISDMFLNQNLTNKIVNRSNQTLKFMSKKLEDKDKQQNNSNLISSGINTLKNTASFNCKNEKPRKEESVIDYVESAFDKEIKQKIQPLQSFSSDGAAQSGNGPVTNSININKNSLSTSSLNKVEDLKQKSSLSKNSDLTIDFKDKIISQSSHVLPTEQIQQQNNKFSVKEKIMMFTNSNKPIMTQSNILQKNHLLIKQAEPKLIKSTLVTSSPSINSELKPSESFKTNNIKSNNNIISDVKKFNSTNSLNKSIASSFNSEPKLSEKASFVKQESNKLVKNEKTETENIPTFKSIKDKIAYFSSKLNQENSNLSQNTSNISHKKSFNDSNTSLNKVKPDRNYLANKIEIISSSVAEESALKQYLSQDNFEDYDSLKHAYKLNSLNNSSSFSNQYGKSCLNLKTCYKNENFIEIKNTHASTNSINISYGSNAKVEIKNIIHNNENKISDMIENIETKMKNGYLFQ